jgi:hypothetical protein
VSIFLYLLALGATCCYLLSTGLAYAVAHAGGLIVGVIILLVCAVVVSIPFVVSRFVQNRFVKVLLMLLPIFIPSYFFIMYRFVEPRNFQSEAESFLRSIQIKVENVEFIKDPSGHDIGIVVNYAVNATRPAPLYKPDGRGIGTEVYLVSNYTGVMLRPLPSQIFKVRFSNGSGGDRFFSSALSRLNESPPPPLNEFDAWLYRNENSCLSNVSGSHPVKMKFLLRDMEFNADGSIKKLYLERDELNEMRVRLGESQFSVFNLVFESRIVLPRRNGFKDLTTATVPVVLKNYDFSKAILSILQSLKDK